jgi:hypothetical protein
MSYDFDSSSVNPDFLRYNGIVDAGWRVEGPVAAEPGLSRIVYDNGLTVRASKDHVVFIQTGQSMNLDDFVSPGVAMRFMSSVAPRSGYEVVAFDPRGFVRLPEGAPGAPATVLSALGGRLPFEEALPTSVQARVSYDLEGREITLYVGERASELRFSAHIHHNIVGSGVSEQAAFVRTVLDSWRDDLADFDRLAIQFYHEYIKGR